MKGRLPRRIADGTAGRILELLRRQPMTVDELTAALGLTPTAVRGQLALLQQDELVEQRGSRHGTSKPARIYGASDEAEVLLSRAYIPILQQLLDVLARRMTAAELDDVMREVGRGAASGRVAPRGPLRERVAGASALLNQLGGLAEVEEQDGCYVIRSYGCPLAAVTAEHPAVCHALESLLTALIGAPVTNCCERNGRVRCCFKIEADRNA